MIDVIEVAYHRNGISGEGFYAIRFICPDNGPMMAVVFPPEDAYDVDGYFRPPTEFHNPRVAVFNENKLPSITFGINSWRGDNYARELYEAIRAYDQQSQY